MTTTTEYIQLDVCTDCYFAIEGLFEGDAPVEVTAGIARLYSPAEEGFDRVTAGCDTHDDCEGHGFSKTDCQCCQRFLAGDRFPVIATYTVESE